MYHILEESHGNIIGIRVQGKITAEDYATLLPFVEGLIRQHGSIRVFSDLRDYEGIELGAVLKSIPYSFKYSSRVEKKAIITEKQWIKSWTKFLSPFFHTKVKCFSFSQIDEAWNWLKN